MKRIHLLGVIAGLIFGVLVVPPILSGGQEARAQTGAACDASKVIGRCYANASVEGRWLTLTSSSGKCSRVDWTRNGQPQTAVFRGGVERIELLGQGVGEIAVQSCSILETLDEARYDEPELREFNGRCMMEDQDYGTVVVRARSRAEAVPLVERECYRRFNGGGRSRIAMLSYTPPSV